MVVTVISAWWPGGAVPSGADGAAPDGMGRLSARTSAGPDFPRSVTVSIPEITRMVAAAAAAAVHTFRRRRRAESLSPDSGGAPRGRSLVGVSSGSSGPGAADGEPAPSALSVPAGAGRGELPAEPTRDRRRVASRRETSAAAAPEPVPVFGSWAVGSSDDGGTAARSSPAAPSRATGSAPRASRSASNFSTRPATLGRCRGSTDIMCPISARSGSGTAWSSSAASPARMRRMTVAGPSPARGANGAVPASRVYRVEPKA